MTADEFIKLVRAGPEKLRVDEIVISTGSQEAHGRGILRINREKIEVEITITNGVIFPNVPTGIYTKKDNWKVTGLIDDSLRFKCEHAGMPINTHWSFGNSTASGFTRYTFDITPIDLIPSGWDASTRKERKECLEQNKVPTTGWGVDKTEDDVSFYATIFEYPLNTSTWEKETQGETDNFIFVLKKSDQNSDLHISLKSKNNYSSLGEEKDWRKFHAFLNALAFVNGINAWPYRVEYWRAGQKLIDRVTATRNLAKTIHAPFPETLAFNARNKSIKWNLQETIKLITKFFETESPLSEEVAYLSFLFRQAGTKGVHRDITTLTLCALLENLARHIFKGLDLEKKTRLDKPEITSFELAKNEILAHLNPILLPSNPAHKRIYTILKSSEAFSTRQIFEAVTQHLGLQWESDMELVFKTWQQTRNTGVHRSGYSARSEDDWREISLAESRIAGAINVMMLKLFGYSGYVRHSAYEDGYRQI